MARHYGFRREFTSGLLDSGYVPSICDDLRKEVEIRVPLEIEFDSKEYVDMEKAYHELKQLLNLIRLNILTGEVDDVENIIDPDTLEDVNSRLPLVCPEIACMRANGQLVYVDKPLKEESDILKIKKDLDSFTKKLQMRDIKEYIKDIHMVSEEEYSSRVERYYNDEDFSKTIKLPYISFKLDKKYRGGMVASDNPISLAKTGFESYKQLEADIICNLKSPYYIRFNRGIGESTNFSIYDARSYYCMEIYKDSKGDFQIRGIRYVDVRKDHKSGKLILKKTLPEDCCHITYLFKNEYIKVYKKGKIINNGFGAYRGVENINRNTGKIRLFSNSNLMGRDTTINLASEIRKIEMSLTGHIIGEQRCGDQSLFITGRD